ncbi:hypothetical protein IFM89_033543 [Coptis chinensis]|uniref:Aminotransferase class V domain-containing protein n=1 Tax=Coptis chinensis TaxID=261450 RepID=A0A835HAG4_9MAGN|nr:hypothetical protein IFM89_033543 [Coptis chinensis]
MVVDVQSLDADFLVASSHKICGPTGTGFIYGKSKVLSGMPPFLGGGEMISDVFLDHSTYAERPPSRLLTPSLWFNHLQTVVAHLPTPYWTNGLFIELATYLHESLCVIPNVRIYGPVPSEHVSRAALCSFNVENIHPTDIATFLDQEYGVPIRSGHHCAQPLHRYLEINASVCASLHFYNTKDVDAFIRALKGTIDFFITGLPSEFLLSSFRAKKEKVEEIGELTELATYLHESLPSIPNVCIYGPVPSEHVCRAALCSFNVEIKIFIRQTLRLFLIWSQNCLRCIANDSKESTYYGVAIRSGHHGAQPLHRYLGINASARASLHFYNTKEDVDAFITALKGTIDFFVSSL